jgi:predicted CoA-binding protein
VSFEDVFRNPAFVDPIVDECLQLGVKAIWLQDGVINEPAAKRAPAESLS